MCVFLAVNGVAGEKGLLGRISLLFLRAVCVVGLRIVARFGWGG